MHVCIDYRPALHESTGVGSYVRGLAAALLRQDPAPELSVFSASLRHRLGTRPELVGASIVDARFPVRALDWLWHRRRWPPVETWSGPIDIAHSPTPLPLPSRARKVVTVHDCYFLRHPEDVSGPVKRDYIPLFRRGVADADAVVTISASTRQELLDAVQIAEHRIHVTHLGVDRAFCPPDSPPIPGPPRFLFVGRREPRKDMPTILRGFAAVLGRFPEARLDLVGPDGPGWDSALAAAPSAVREHTRCIGYASRAELVRHYQTATALLLPSRWEGFGLTAVEAMACGTPVIATRVGALPEILGDAPTWIEVGDDEALADACGRLIEDSAEIESRRALGLQRALRYTWEATAASTYAAYEAAIAS